jgi:hypothetical protein
MCMLVRQLYKEAFLIFSKHILEISKVAIILLVINGNLLFYISFF